MATKHTCSRCMGLYTGLVSTLINYGSGASTRREHWVHPHFGDCFRSLRDDNTKMRKRMQTLESKVKELKNGLA